MKIADAFLVIDEIQAEFFGRFFLAVWYALTPLLHPTNGCFKLNYLHVLLKTKVYNGEHCNISVISKTGSKTNLKTQLVIS